MDLEEFYLIYAVWGFVASKYDGSTIEIINWLQFNPRTDAKKPSWFRLENDLALGDSLFGLNCEHKWLWIVILTLASKENGKPFKWNSSYVEANTGISDKTQTQAIDSFVEKFNLKVTLLDTRVARTADESNISDTHATNERTERTERTNGTDDRPRRKHSDPERFAAISVYSGIDTVVQERKISEQVQLSWTQAFPDPEWVMAEIRKAIAWEASNPIRRKVNFSAFITRWLAKDWDRRKIPGHGFNKAEARQEHNKSALETYKAALESKNES